MGIWILTIALGVCTLGSLYMTFLSAKDGDSRGAWLFASFGLLFGTPLSVFGIKAMAGRKGFFKTIDERISGRTGHRTGFVPHWFLTGAIIIIFLVIGVSTLIKIIR